MRWGELVEAVNDWQARTGIDPADLRILASWPEGWGEAAEVGLVTTRGVVLDVDRSFPHDDD